VVKEVRRAREISQGTFQIIKVQRSASKARRSGESHLLCLGLERRSVT